MGRRHHGVAGACARPTSWPWPGDDGASSHLASHRGAGLWQVHHRGELAARSPRGVHVVGDQLQDLIVSGNVLPSPEGSEESDRRSSSASKGPPMNKAYELRRKPRSRRGLMV